MIIAEGPAPTAHGRLRRTAYGAFGISVLLGTLAAAWYAAAGLSLSHYDAKAHLVVARRIIDNLTPGWEQIGAVWLPLPHLLNVLPVQVDAFYRTGASGIAISVLACGAAAAGAALLVQQATGSAVAGLTAAILLTLNPNVLYLQSTPMTEPLLLGFTLLGLAALYRWLESDDPRAGRAAGLLLAGACWTRYEAWPVAMSGLGLALIGLVWGGRLTRVRVRALGKIAACPVIAILAFFLLSRATVGEWLVTGGFFVPDNPAQGDIVRSGLQIVGGVNRLAGVGLASVAAAAGALAVGAGVLRRRHASRLVLLAVLGAATLPWYAYFEGHPFRIRYMIPLLAATSIGIGLGIGLLPRFRVVAAVAALVLGLASRPPLSAEAAMIEEAKWDLPKSLRRQAVTSCLAARYDGEKILASMGSLAHYMQETSAAGFGLRDYVHEGTGTFWLEAIVRPKWHVGWILIEERAEGGDELFGRARRYPEFLDGFERVCEGGGVALYRRTRLP